MRWASSGGADAVLGDQEGQRGVGVVRGPPQAVAEGLRIELVAHVEDGYARFGPDPSVGADPHAGVHLDAQEVVPLGAVEKHVLGVVADAPESLLATGSQLVVGHRQGQADRDTGGGLPDRRHGGAVSRHQIGPDPLREILVGLAGWEHPGVPSHGGHNVGLVDGAGPGDHPGRAPAPRRRRSARTGRSCPCFSQPPSAANQRGVVKWWKVTTGSTPRSRRPSHCRR